MFTKTLVVAALTLAATATPSEAARESNITTQASTEATTAWQLYTFAQSWQPEFCYGQSYPGCSSPNAFWKTSFTIHGLWPDVTSGQYPSACSTEAFNLAKVTAAVPLATLQKYWPNWLTHGTCTGLDQATYFKTAVNMMISDPTPSFVGTNYGKAVTATALRNAYGGANQVVLSCSGQYLTQVLTCWTKGAGNAPTGRRACSSNLLADDNCSGTITIAAF